MAGKSNGKVKTRRTYSNAIKHEAVRRYRAGEPATSVVKSLGLSGPSLVYVWSSNHESHMTPGHLIVEQETTPELRRRLADLLQEIDTLKKTVAILCK